MTKVIFRNLKKSDLIRTAVESQITSIQERYAEELKGDPTVIVSMENSPRQAGVDSFSVKILGLGRRLGFVTFHKSSTDFYEALKTTIQGFTHVLDKGLKKRRTKAKRERRRQSWALAS